MQQTGAESRLTSKSRGLRLLNAWRRDTQGVTAIEFGFVAVPFLMFIFGIIGLALHFFISTTLEKGLEASARKVRTGQAQTAGMTVQQFQEDVCAEAKFQSGAWIDCNKLKVHMQNSNDFSFTPVECLPGGALGSGNGNAGDSIESLSGGASQTVLVVACYERENVGLPYFSLENMSNGSELIQLTTTFRTEPYAD